IIVVWAVVTFIPAIPELLHRFSGIPVSKSITNAEAAFPALSQAEWGLVTVVVIVSATVLVLPVAWVYMFTKRRGGYDQSVVHTVIMLPLTVAGTVILVRNSLALAFALAAIVAAVRFRNTLKDTKDTVYVFLALAVGVAAGVNALTIAAVLSAMFNVGILFLWRFNVGNIYADRLGDERAARLGPLVEASAEEKRKKRFNAALIVSASVLTAAQRVAEAVLEDHAERWKLASVVPSPSGMNTVEYLVRVRDEARMTALVNEIRIRGAPDIVNVEFRSLRGLEQREIE
ncbi:MAG TPA: DUF4956 domain-containing protein, partial [Gemmatimonadaceae bacterium]|nr:DUF4956 domain-containing protein [Gemmatimonadaceae bacterium]